MQNPRPSHFLRKLWLTETSKLFKLEQEVEAFRARKTVNIKFVATFTHSCKSDAEGAFGKCRTFQAQF
jgi:hypothetical protein